MRSSWCVACIKRDHLDSTVFPKPCPEDIESTRIDLAKCHAWNATIQPRLCIIPEATSEFQWVVTEIWEGKIAKPLAIVTGGRRLLKYA
jgi:hypothetical protein